MSFNLRNLSILAYAQGNTLWIYTSGAATLAECTTPGYFRDASDMLAPRDVILVTVGDGARMLVVRNAEGNTGPLTGAMS